MAGRDDPPEWKPDLVRAPLTPEQKRLARNKYQRDCYARKISERRVHQKASYVIVTHRPPLTKRPSGPRTPTRPGAHLIRLTAGAWLRFLVLSYIARGPYRVRDISRTLGTDPTSVAQSICELKRMGLLPSQLGRTPTRSRP